MNWLQVSGSSSSSDVSPSPSPEICEQPLIAINLDALPTEVQFATLLLYVWQHRYFKKRNVGFLIDEILQASL